MAAVFTKLATKIKSMNFVKNYKKIYPYVKPYKYWALLSIIITMPIGAMDGFIAWVLKPYMDVVMIEKNTEAGTLIPLLIIAFALTQSLLNYASTYLNSWVGGKITMGLKAKLFEKLMLNEPSFFDKTTSGDVHFRFNSDAERACAGLLTHIKTFTTRVFASISLIAVLIINSWQLAIVAIIILFGALIPLAKFRKRINKAMEGTVISLGLISTHYNESYGGNRVISSYNLHEYQQSKFNDTLTTLFRLGMKITKRTGLLSPMMHLIVSIGIAVVIWLGSYLIINGELTPGGFVSFITALLLLYQPIKNMGSNFAELQMAFMAMERVFEMVERTPKIKNAPDAIKLEKIEGKIVFKDVSFEYLPDRPVLKNINVEIPVGSTYALVGNSGGGKTTFSNLLPRFYDVKKGSILINGIDIRKYDLKSLRDNIAIVFQDNFLFTGTIRTNILLGRTDVSEEQVKNAIKCACLDEFVNSLAQGVDTEIGERGILLSGGQKQRVAIARAFIKNAPIVILDEATSSLDNKSEAVVQQAINNLMEDRTVIVIAHRLSTVKNADKLLVINHGEIVEVGSHDELLKKENSTYASLYKSQLK